MSSIFDTILDTLQPLQDVVEGLNEGDTDTLINLGKKAFKSVGDITGEARERAAAAQKGLKDYSIGINTPAQAAKSKYGVENFSENPMAVERQWQSILTTFLSPQATKGK
jgi:hypothetical protein